MNTIKLKIGQNSISNSIVKSKYTQNINISEVKNLFGDSKLIDDYFLKGGYKVVSDIDCRNNISCEYRKLGMQVMVVGPDASFKKYILKGNDPCSNEGWEEILNATNEVEVKLVEDYSVLGDSLNTQRDLNLKLKQLILNLQTQIDLIELSDEKVQITEDTSFANIGQSQKDFNKNASDYKINSDLKNQEQDDRLENIEGENAAQNDLINDLFSELQSEKTRNDIQDNALNNLEGIYYIWSPTNRTLTLYDREGTQLSQVSLVSLDNEGTDLRYNASTLSLELYNKDNELLDSIPVSSFIGSVGTQLQLNSNQLQLKDSQGNILSTVTFEVSNISGLQTALDNKQDVLTEDNLGQFMGSELSTKSALTSEDTVLGRDSLTGKAVEIPTSSLVELIDVSNLVPYTSADKDVNIASNYFKTSKGFDFTFDAYNYFNTYQSDYYSTLEFKSKDSSDDNFGYLQITANAEEGFNVDCVDGNGATANSLQVNINGTSSPKAFISGGGFKTPFGTPNLSLTADGGTFDLNNKADLVDGKVPSSQLPSYVDDVLEFANLASFPATGESGKIYIALDTNITYRWSGTGYAEISTSLVLGETVNTAYRGDKGKIAYDHSQVTHDKNLVGLGNVDNTSDLNKPISNATQLALNGKQDLLTNPITGTGTVNRISKFTASGTIGDSQIFDNGTNVGIGEAQTTARFSIKSQGALATDIAFRVRNSGNTANLVELNGLGRLGLGVSPTSKFDIQTEQDTAILSTELLTSSGWTTTDWTGDFTTGFKHTTGNTSVLSNSFTPLNNNLYQVLVTVSGRTAGSITVNFGGITQIGITYTINISQKTSGTNNLQIIPTSDFNGTISISIKTISAYSPALQFRNSSGTVANEIRISSINTNTFVGLNTGMSNTKGANNSFFGANVGKNTTTGINSSAFGLYALGENTTGSYNSAFGLHALSNNTTGGYNSAFGLYALQANTTGNNNSALGSWAGRFTNDGGDNAISNNSVYLGNDTRANANNETNQIVIGSQAKGNGSNSVTLGNDSITKTVLKGNVGIGTTTPSEQLEVNGSVKATGFKTPSGTANQVLTSDGGVSDLNLKLSIESPSTTGTAISFTVDRVYGTLTTPETGNITADVTNAKLGVTNIIIHNSGTAPTFGSEFKKLSGSGNYVTGVVNYIYCTFITNTEIIYSINQRT